MNFKSLQDNLRATLWRKMNNGGVTGIALAEDAGIGQAHMSNFLNGKRGLSLEAMDRVLATQSLTIFDLLDPAQIDRYASIPTCNDAEFATVPLVDAQIAASADRINRGVIRETLKFSANFLRGLRSLCEPARAHWERFVALRVDARDGMSMFPRLMPGAIILVDRHYHAPKPYRRGESTMFAVRRAGIGCVIRYVEMAGHTVLLRPHNTAYPLEILTLSRRHTAPYYIVGRVAHVGLET